MAMQHLPLQVVCSLCRCDNMSCVLSIRTPGLHISNSVARGLPTLVRDLRMSGPTVHSRKEVYRLRSLTTVYKANIKPFVAEKTIVSQFPTITVSRTWGLVVLL